MQTLPVHLAPGAAFEALAPRRKVLLVGDGAAGVYSYIVARRACEKRPVRIICGDNRFSVYAVAKFARAQRIRPVDALRSILIARAFTAYQLVELILRLDPDANDFVIITGICSLFGDTDMADAEAARLFYKVFWRLDTLTRKGLSILLVEASPLAVERRQYFLQDLIQASEVVVSLGDHASFTLDFSLPREPSRAQRRRHVLNRLIGT